jgi:hypothetical protein
VNGTLVFHYQHAPVRVRVYGGEPVWFARDLAAAVGLRLPSGPLPAAPHAPPGVATAAQVWTVVQRAGCGAPDGLRAWMTEVSAQLAARLPSQPARGARTHPATPRRKSA